MSNATAASHNPEDFSWAIPLMRAGYAGRGVVYTVVSLFTLWAIWFGGSGNGTEDTTTVLQKLENTAFGGIVLVVIVLGMFAYAAWRLSDAFWDLEDYGDDVKGTVARAGMIVTGAVHGALGFAALFVLLGTSASNDGGQSGIAKAVENLLGMPGGHWIVGAAGVLTMGAGIYYAHKAWTASYRRHIMANEFTMNWNTVLRIGVAAQAFVVGVIGFFILLAALRSDASEAGGLGRTFEWLSGQAYGMVFVSGLALGLLAFAVFCFVNAAYRIVPLATDRGLKSMARAIADKARQS